MQDIGRGSTKYVAARLTFRRLFLAGLTALLTNIVGFAVLFIIDIPIIRDVAITSSLGISLLIFTKLILIPVTLSYIGVSPAAAKRSLSGSDANARGSRFLSGLTLLTQPLPSLGIIFLAGCLTIAALNYRSGIQVGDIDPGAPELRPESTYNRDVNFIASNFGLANDQFVVLHTSKPDECMTLDSLSQVDFLGEALRQVEGVRGVYSVADGVRFAVSGTFEGNPKWMTLPRNVSNLRTAYGGFANARPDMTDEQCTILPVVVSLNDHRANTLTRVVEATRTFAQNNVLPDRQILMAAGNGGIEAATNIVVMRSFWTMHAVLYGAVVLLCLLTFRSVKATIVALVPLIITSLLCEALMAVWGIGLKVATLPVIAVGVGVGVDYALYLLSVQLSAQRRGLSLRDAYRESLNFTGRIVALVGIMMSVGVVTWIWSPIKFQADMGILLTFMFLWNMVGALTMIPALSYWLLNGKGKEIARA